MSKLVINIVAVMLLVSVFGYCTYLAVYSRGIAKPKLLRVTTEAALVTTELTTTTTELPNVTVATPEIDRIFVYHFTENVPAHVEHRPRIPHQFGLEIFGPNTTGTLFEQYEWRGDSLDQLILTQHCEVKLAITLSFYFANRITRDHVYDKVKRNILYAYCDLRAQLNETELEQDRQRLEYAQLILLKIVHEITPYKLRWFEMIREFLAFACPKVERDVDEKRKHSAILPFEMRENILMGNAVYYRIPHDRNLLELWETVEALQTPKKLDKDLGFYLSNQKFLRDTIMEQCLASVY